MSAMLVLAQVRDVEVRANQAGFLGGPPGEAHLVGRLGLRHLLGDLEQRARAGAVVVDARTLRDGIEVRAGHDHVVRVTLAGLGDQVLRRRGDPGDVGEQAHLEVGDAGQLRTQFVRRAQRWDAAGVGVAQRDRRDPLPAGQVGVALVEEQHADGSGGRRVLRLDHEVAGAALDQRDVAGREAGEVLGLAAAGGGVADAELDVDRGHRSCDVTRLGLRGGPEVGALGVGDGARAGLLEL